jgi:DNA ligase-1
VRDRLDVLDARLPSALVVPRVVTDDVPVAEAFLEDALARGHEGVMVKDLAAPYEAGRRGAGWLKVKPAHTLDLVVLAAEWGRAPPRQARISISVRVIRERRLRDARENVQG